MHIVRIASWPQEPAENLAEAEQFLIKGPVGLIAEASKRAWLPSEFLLYQFHGVKLPLQRKAPACNLWGVCACFYAHLMVCMYMRMGLKHVLNTCFLLGCADGV